MVDFSKIDNVELKKIYKKIIKTKENGYIHDLNEGASEESIIETEKNIGISIPIDYREFLQNTNGGSLFNYVISLIGVYDSIKGSERVEGVAYLDKSMFKEGNDYGIPEGFLAISDTGYGDLVCIDTKSNNNKVVHWNHEIREVEDEWSSFTEWLEETIDDSEDFMY